ncbi:hypothetical protein (nucleomorph) [Guillardia theta]|uniref:Uncharacterized protein n=2 Tax=Guillardia theta TaxID=55529 RepID=Q98S91_GUITH|nr:hypothetical protein GTHECHR3048 [Guillardia theta]AAK39692.1 hypothetical protein [Guillardia theta]
MPKTFCEDFKSQEKCNYTLLSNFKNIKEIIKIHPFNFFFVKNLFFFFILSYNNVLLFSLYNFSDFNFIKKFKLEKNISNISNSKSGSMFVFELENRIIYIYRINLLKKKDLVVSLIDNFQLEKMDIISIKFDRSENFLLMYLSHNKLLIKNIISKKVCIMNIKNSIFININSIHFYFFNAILKKNSKILLKIYIFFIKKYFFDISTKKGRFEFLNHINIFKYVIKDKINYKIKFKNMFSFFIFETNQNKKQRIDVFKKFSEYDNPEKIYYFNFINKYIDLFKNENVYGIIDYNYNNFKILKIVNEKNHRIQIFNIFKLNLKNIDSITYFGNKFSICISLNNGNFLFLRRTSYNILGFIENKKIITKMHSVKFLLYGIMSKNYFFMMNISTKKLLVKIKLFVIFNFRNSGSSDPKQTIKVLYLDTDRCLKTMVFNIESSDSVKYSIKYSKKNFDNKIIYANFLNSESIIILDNSKLFIWKFNEKEPKILINNFTRIKIIEIINDLNIVIFVNKKGELFEFDISKLSLIKKGFYGKFIIELKCLNHKLIIIFFKHGMIYILKYPNYEVISRIDHLRKFILFAKVNKDNSYILCIDKDFNFLALKEISREINYIKKKNLKFVKFVIQKFNENSWGDWFFKIFEIFIITQNYNLLWKLIKFLNKNFISLFKKFIRVWCSKLSKFLFYLLNLENLNLDDSIILKNFLKIILTKSKNSFKNKDEKKIIYLINLRINKLKFKIGLYLKLFY